MPDFADFNNPPKDELRPQNTKRSHGNPNRHLEGNASFERILGALGTIPALEGIFQNRGNIHWKDTEDRIREHILGSLGKITGFREASRELGRALHGKTLIEGGQEHFLYPDQKTGTVLKLTFGNNFGARLRVYPELPEIGRGSVLATTNIDPAYYLQRWMLLNEHFPPVTRFEAVLPPHPGERLPRFAIRQKQLVGTNPPLAKIQQAFRNLGFVEIADHAFYRIEDNLLLGDAAPRNIRFENHKLIPFDAIAEQPEEETRELCILKAEKYA